MRSPCTGMPLRGDAGCAESRTMLRRFPPPWSVEEADVCLAAGRTARLPAGSNLGRDFGVCLPVRSLRSTPARRA
jgi:hypothetical protein